MTMSNPSKPKPKHKINDNLVNPPIKQRKQPKKIEDLDLTPVNDLLIREISETLRKQVNKEIFEKKYAPAKEILKLVGIGAFLTASIVMPNLPLALKPFLKNNDEYEAWKRFNIPYLKRTLARLEKQKLVETSESLGKQVVKITQSGKRKILKFVLEEIEIKKPTLWDGRWRLVSYDIPKGLEHQRNFFRHFLIAWGFYPLHESVLLHAYSCEREVEFLKEYLGLGEFVRILLVSKIENNEPFKKFFNI